MTIAPRRSIERGRSPGPRAESSGPQPPDALCSSPAPCACESLPWSGLPANGALETLFGSGAALQAAERALQQRLRARGVYFGDGLLPTYAYAFVASRERIDHWAEQAELLIAAAEHLTGRLLDGELAWDAPQLDREAIELIRTDPGYARNCVICRPDGIPVGPEMKFVEINCDSPAMMAFLDIVAECVLELDAFAALRGAAPAPSCRDQLLDTLLACYREYGGRDVPTLAITDWEAQKTRYEHLRLAEHFTARGVPTVICDPRAFRRAGGALYVDGRRIDLVYRRALASEVIARRDELAPLLRAYRDGAICMVNPLRSYVASAKSLLAQLGSADLPAALRPAARLVPPTVLLDDRERAAVAAEPGRWALKKSEGHGGMNVVLPKVSSESARRDAIAASAREVWIAQEVLDVPRLALPVADGDAVAWCEKYYNWNPFVFGGRYAGGMVRVSGTPLINICLGGGLLPTLRA